MENPRQKRPFLMVHSPSTTQGSKAPRLHALSLWPSLRPPPPRWRRGRRATASVRVVAFRDRHRNGTPWPNIPYVKHLYLWFWIIHIPLKKKLFVYVHNTYMNHVHTHYILYIYNIYTVGSPQTTVVNQKAMCHWLGHRTRQAAESRTGLGLGWHELTMDFTKAMDF